MIQLYDMNYVTTNVRIPETDYLRLKVEAAQKRLSLAAVIRKKISTSYHPHRSAAEVKKIMTAQAKLAKQNAKILKGVDSVKMIREMRDQAKW